MKFDEKLSEKEAENPIDTYVPVDISVSDELKKLIEEDLKEKKRCLIC